MPPERAWVMTAQLSQGRTSPESGLNCTLTMLMQLQSSTAHVLMRHNPSHSSVVDQLSQVRVSPESGQNCMSTMYTPSQSMLP